MLLRKVQLILPIILLRSTFFFVFAALVEQQIDVVTLVSKMGSQLTSVDDLVRSRGTLLLANVLDSLPNLKLTAQQLS